MTQQAKVIGADLLFLFLICFQFPLVYVIAYIIKKTNWQMSTVESLVITQGYLCISVLIYLLITKQNIWKTIRFCKFHIGSVCLVVLLLVTFAPFSVLVNLISQLFASNTISQTVFEISDHVPILTGVLVIGLLPGIVEEVIYRGVMLSAHNMRSIKAGILISALTFSFMHMNLNQMTYAFFLGILFAITVEVTGSILSSILMHVTFNAFNALYMYALPFLLGLQEKLSGEVVDIEEVMAQGIGRGQILLSIAFIMPFAVGGLVLTGLLLYAIAKLNKRENILKSLYKKEYAADSPIDQNVSALTPWLVIGLVLCLLMAVATEML